MWYGENESLSMLEWVIETLSDFSHWVIWPLSEGSKTVIEYFVMWNFHQVKKILQCLYIILLYGITPDLVIRHEF